ncbi:hypothetical protein ACA910_009825 [Epithemia clementina (nom. ined.)]
MGKEGGKLMQANLRELFIKFKKSANTGVTEKYDWMLLNDATNADMNAVWKTNEFGCATKTRGDSKPCHCCLVKNDELVLPNPDKSACRWCTSSGAADDSTKRCYHHRIVTEEVAANMEVKLRALEEIFNGMLKEVELFQQQSLIHTTDNPKVATAASLNDICSVHFLFDSRTPRSVISEYNAKIVHDLELRGMDSSGRLWTREERDYRLG